MHVVHALAEELVRLFLRLIPRDQSVTRVAPRLPAVLRQPHAGRGDPDGQTVRIAGPRGNRVQAEPSCAGWPIRAAGLVPERSVQLPGLSAVAALEERRRCDTREELPFRLPGLDHPRARDRLTRVFGERGALRLLPLAERIVGEVKVRSVLPVRHARVVRAGARVAGRVLAHETLELPSRELHPSAAFAAKDAQALVRPHQKLGLVGTAADVLDDLHAITLLDARGQSGALSVDEHVDVLSDLALLVEYPPRELRMLPLESFQHFSERRP